MAGRRERRGCADRRETEALAAAAEAEAAKIRGGYIDPKAPAYLTHEARPLSDHLDAFRASLEAKGNTIGHAKKTTARARRVVELAGARRISDLTFSKALDALARLRAEGMAAETINHHVRAVKAFARWLWKDGRAREHALAHLSTSNPEADRRRRRRALSAEEARRLIEAAEAGPVVLGMSGRDRAAAYALALATGFRASELASLTPEAFNLKSGEVVVSAAYAKNRRQAAQPLPSALVPILRVWLAEKAPGRPVLKLPDRTAEMIRRDLVAAGIAPDTPSGVVDFHALRSTYITELVRSGASVKTCQELARHSTPSLTIGLYAKVDRHDLTAAVEALPNPTAPRAPESAAATGTDGRISKPLSLHFPYGPDATGRSLTVCSDDASAPRASAALPQTLAMTDPVASGRDESQCRRWDSNPQGDAPRGILSPLRLPFRHTGERFSMERGVSISVTNPGSEIHPCA